MQYYVNYTCGSLTVQDNYSSAHTPHIRTIESREVPEFIFSHFLPVFALPLAVFVTFALAGFCDSGFLVGPVDDFAITTTS